MIHLLLAVVVASFSRLTLDGAQSAAVAHSPDVAIARAKVEEAQALFDAARAQYAPTLTANYAEAPQGGDLGQVVAQRLTTFGATIALGDLFAASPAVAQANASLRAAQFDFDDARRSERIAVIGYYYDALDALATADARTAAVRDAQAQLRAAHLRFRAGDAPRLDEVRASVALANAQADLARAAADAQNATDTLAQETAVDSAALVTTARDESVTPLIPTDVHAAVRLALSLRPEIASAQADVDAETHAVEVAKRAGIPAVTLAGGYTTGVDTGIKVSGPSANLTMTVPLGGAAHDRVAAEEARLAQAQAQLEKVRRSITVSVGAAVRTETAQGVALAAAERALREAKAQYDATQIGYRSGASSSLDVESARTTYVAALVAELSAYYDVVRAQATLQMLMGDEHA
ncbi:MAG: TolC family protein [Candidatus Aquilonibacter sp.]